MAVTTPFSTPPASTGFVVFSTNDVTIPAISGYVPQLGDAIYVFGNQDTVVSMFTTADWGLASVTVPTATNTVFLRAHAITQAEVTAGTNSWVISGVFASGGNGRGIAVVVRGSDLAASPVITSSTANANAVTPPTVTPARDGALIMSYVAPDGRGRGISDPSIGWSGLQKASAISLVPSQLLMRRSTNAAGGVPVDMTNAAVTLGAVDDVGAITVAVSPPASTSGFFAVFS